MSFNVAMRKAPSPDAPMGNITPYGLRLQAELKRQLEVAAKANGRSLNSEISARLEKSVHDEERAGTFGTVIKSAAVQANLQDRALESRLSQLEMTVQEIKYDISKIDEKIKMFFEVTK